MKTQTFLSSVKITREILVVSDRRTVCSVVRSKSCKQIFPKYIYKKKTNY